MSKNSDDLRIALTEASARLAVEPEPFITLFERGDFCVELYAPRGVDNQESHEQDEAYIIASGTGMFRRAEERVPFQPGDFLFAAAGGSAPFRGVHRRLPDLGDLLRPERRPWLRSRSRLRTNRCPTRMPNILLGTRQADRPERTEAAAVQGLCRG
jgi:hypothetical protein